MLLGMAEGFRCEIPRSEGQRMVIHEALRTHAVELRLEIRPREESTHLE
jgi:hypothetical protein